jgi:hypothetical protein
MPSGNPINPRILKGALVAYESQMLGPVPNIIVFQYNAEQLSRSLAHRTPPREAGSVGAAKEEVQRVMGPPVETITLSVELDAADQHEEPTNHPHVASHGLHPALAALELLLYPSSAQVLLNKSLAQAGSAQICPSDIPLVLFVWGPSRVVPVKLTSFSITEEAFDRSLNPVRAKVELGMQVLTYMELKDTTIGYNAYLATQVQKEVFARMNLIRKAEELIGISPF